MARPEQHNCLFCGEMFRAEPRNAGHQKYCSASSKEQVANKGKAKK